MGINFRDYCSELLLDIIILIVTYKGNFDVKKLFFVPRALLERDRIWSLVLCENKIPWKQEKSCCGTSNALENPAPI